MRGQNFVCVVYVAIRRNIHRLGHFYFQVRRGNRPPIRPFLLRRRIGWIARGRIGFGPCREQSDLLLRQRQVIRKLSNSFFRKPRRHGAILRRSPNGSRVRSRAFVIFKRHRRNSATAVANLTMLLENGQDVPVKRWVCYGSGNLMTDQRRTGQKHERRESRAKKFFDSKHPAGTRLPHLLALLSERDRKSV